MGWFTINDKTDVLWKLAGDRFKDRTTAYLWVDAAKKVHTIENSTHVEGLDRVEGLGYVLVTEETRRSYGASATVDLVLTEAEMLAD